MATILFVHGTGVRRPSYLETFALLKDAFEKYGVPHDLAPCLWGDDLGAVDPMLSLPNPLPRTPGPSRWTEDQELARWELLYRDPLFELRLLKQRPGNGPLPPGILRPDRALWNRIQGYECSSSLLALLRYWRLSAYWDNAWARVIVDDPTEDALKSSPEEIGEPGQAIARALVATILQNAIENGGPLPDGPRRDEIVDQLIDDWDARVAGIGTFLIRFFGNAVATISTPIVKWKRSQLTTAASPAAGDILLYQARGERIRKYIRSCAEGLNTEVILLAHSLGGIACVDLLALERVQCITHLITVGSQAPLLHEIGALRGLEPGTKSLPLGFPVWLNIYDPNDFLSYMATRVFVDPKVQDLRVESGQPFPHSHGAYWANPDTWNEIRKFLS